MLKLSSYKLADHLELKRTTVQKWRRWGQLPGNENPPLGRGNKTAPLEFSNENLCALRVLAYGVKAWSLTVPAAKQMLTLIAACFKHADESKGDRVLAFLAQHPKRNQVFVFVNRGPLRSDVRDSGTAHTITVFDLTKLRDTIAKAPEKFGEAVIPEAK